MAVRRIRYPTLATAILAGESGTTRCLFSDVSDNFSTLRPKLGYGDSRLVAAEPGRKP